MQLPQNKTLATILENLTTTPLPITITTTATPMTINKHTTMNIVGEMTKPFHPNDAQTIGTSTVSPVTSALNVTTENSQTGNFYPNV